MPWSCRWNGRTLIEMGEDSNLSANGLRACRIAQGLSLDDVSALSGISQPQLSRLERGQRKLTPETAKKLARALGTGVRSITDPAVGAR